MKTIVLRTVLFVLGLSAINTVAAQPAPGKPGAVESGYIEVEGGRIFYEAAGDGPAVVMIHDGLLHRETWSSQFAGFAESHRVIRWDRRGYGRSDSPDAPFRNLDDLFALMKALESSTRRWSAAHRGVCWPSNSPWNTPRWSRRWFWWARS